jgi:membrane fusion protein (multidrug efflux system)
MSHPASPSSRSRSVPARALGLLVVAALGIGCGGPGGTAFGRGPAEDEDDEVEQPTPVVTAIVKAGPIEDALQAASTIEAERAITVHAESTGRIVHLDLEEGDTVDKGTLIARIKYDAQAASLDRASTSLDKARTDLDTVRRLYEQRVASKDELDAAELTFKTAQLDVGDRQREIRNTKVLAPLGGTVTERFVSQGAFVTSGAQLLSITDFKSLVARVYVPEKELDRIAVGQPAQVVGKAAKGRAGEGKIERIAPVVDAATGTVKVTVALPPELAGGEAGFLPGMYAEVTLTTERKDRATLVPKEALVWDEEQAYVFVLEGERVRRQAVALGLRDAAHAEVVSGLAPGAEIVSVGHAGLKEGALVRRVDRNGNAVDAPAADAGAVDIADRSSGGGA